MASTILKERYHIYDVPGTVMYITVVVLRWADHVQTINKNEMGKRITKNTPMEYIYILLCYYGDGWKKPQSQGSLQTIVLAFLG